MVSARRRHHPGRARRLHPQRQNRAAAPLRRDGLLRLEYAGHRRLRRQGHPRALDDREYLALQPRRHLGRRPLAHPHQPRRVRPPAQLRLQHPQGKADTYAQPGPLPGRSRRYQETAQNAGRLIALNSPVQSWQRTAARASEKVTSGLAYHAARLGWTRPRAARSLAQSVTSESRASKQGVVRAMARSDHWRCVSTPRCRRTSAKVTSTDQRRTNSCRMATGSAAWSVHRNACGSNSPAASRTSTQRIGTCLPG